MINLDDEEAISLLSDLIGKNARNCFRRLVKNETKPEKFETRILCLCDFRSYVILIKNNKPSKIELQFHFLDIKRLESLSKSQLFILTSDNRELKVAPYEASPAEVVESIYSEIDDIDEFSLTVIDEIISCYCSNFLNIFPSITIRDLIDTVNIQPEMRLNAIYNDITEMKTLKKKLQLCGCYSKSYSVHCNFIGMNCFQEVVWDVNLIYGQNGLTEFSLNDFDYVNPKDSVPLISGLKYNSWFEGFHSDGIKLSGEMQDELARVIALPMCNIQNLTLLQTHLKQDFLQKILGAFQASKSFKQYSLISSTNGKTTNSFTKFKSINLSRNSIEDKGLNSLSNLFREFPILCNLNSLVLSRCSLTTKSLNTFFSSVTVNKTLKHLDLSYNNLKEEPVELYKFLSEPNELIELNLSNTDLDVEKLFNWLARGGCDSNLKKMNLSGVHSFSKISHSNDNLAQFIRSTQSLVHLDLSGCKLPGTIVQAILMSLKLNPYVNDGFFFNLSTNDLGSSLKTFMYEFNNVESLTALDLSDNNLDNDADILINQLQHTNIKSLSLSKNFHNAKSKVINRIVLSLTTWAVSKYTTLKKLWLVDCRLRSHLNDFINELGSFSQLRLLDISGNDIGDIGINYLSKSLQVNRSLQYLMFDRSNVSVLAYTNIIEAIQRNSSLKSIQIPISDICNLYQKSPDKINDIAKQMTELFSHRKLVLNAQNKCDLDQLFKTKMKLINEPFAATTSLNSHSIPRSPSHAVPMLYNKPNESENSVHDLHAANKINTPQYIKEILQNLNECATAYLSEKPIEQQFANFNTQILEKIDEVTSDLETELNNTLRRKYPSYTSNQSILKNEKDYSCAVDLTSLKTNINEYMSSMLIQIHNDLCEMTYKMSATMAEKLINESQKNPNKHSVASVIQNSACTATPTTNMNKNTISELESVLSNRHAPESSTASDSQTATPSKKPPNGGVKCLPFLPPASKKTVDPSTNPAGNVEYSNAVQHRFELTNNSKSKRPISSQLQETVPLSPNPNGTATVSNAIGQMSQSGSRHGVIGFLPIKPTLSSSIENLCQSEDETDMKRDNADNKVSNPSSREKTPDSFHNELENALQRQNKPVPSTDEAFLSKSPNETTSTDIGFKMFSSHKSTDPDVNTTPVPLPRKMNKPSFVKSFLGLGNSNHNSPSTPKQTESHQSSSRVQQPTASPSLSRKALAPVAMEAPLQQQQPMAVDIKVESLEESTESSKPLQHMTKTRAMRPNRKKPSKNPQAIIESVEQPTLESLDAPMNSSVTKDLIREAVEDTEAAHLEPINQSNEPTKKLSPNHHLPKLNGVEQPKISQNILEGVKLRSTGQISKLKQIQGDQHNSKEDTTSTNTPAVPEPILASATSALNGNAQKKLGNRFSMFEQQATSGNIGFSLPKPAYKKPSPTNNDHQSTSSSESSKSSENLDEVSQEQPSVIKTKPLPPVPPVKPPRPVFNSQLSNKQAANKPDDLQQIPSMLVKLRPVQTNINNGNSTSTSDKLSNELKSNTIFNTNHNNLNNINNHSSNVHINNSIKNNNNLIESNDENGGGVTNGKANGIQRLQDSDKRTSVRELAQMMFEESKA